MRFPKKDARPDKAAHAIRVQMDRLGRVFLCFVSEREVKSENQAPNHADAFHSTAALDPGVRTFQTIYDAEECGHINNSLGGSKTFKCRSCDHCADRDIHAAKNILLRYLSREGIPLPESPA